MKLWPNVVTELLMLVTIPRSTPRDGKIKLVAGMSWIFLLRVSRVSRISSCEARREKISFFIASCETSCWETSDRPPGSKMQHENKHWMKFGQLDEIWKKYWKKMWQSYRVLHLSNHVSTCCIRFSLSKEHPSWSVPTEPATDVSDSCDWFPLEVCIYFSIFDRFWLPWIVYVIFFSGLN